MGANNWSKFRLLMWKNWLLQWRHKIQLLVEILVPILFCGLLVLVRTLEIPTEHLYPKIYNPVSINTLDPIIKIINNPYLPLNVTLKLAYSPNNPYLGEIVTNAAKKFNITAYGVQNANSLESFLAAKNYLAGIAFDDSLASIKNYPKELKYDMKFPGEVRSGQHYSFQIDMTWRTNLLFPIHDAPGPRNFNDDDGGSPPGYYEEGFLAIQNAIATSYIDLVKSNNNEILPDIVIQRYPYPPYTRDSLLQGLEKFVSLIILLCFVYPCSYTVKFITSEKEKQLKEAMKIMGLSNWLHWTAWFVKSMIYMMISITFITILIKIRWIHGSDVAVFTYSDWSTLWFFLFVYSMATTTFCFMLAVFFSKANTAAAVSGIIWFIFYIPFSFTNENYVLMSLAHKLAVCLFSNTAMAYGFQLILRFEGTLQGLQWTNMWHPVSIDDNLTVGYMILMLLLDTVLYMLIALYVEKIFPGEFGVPEKWYFPFTRKFWCGTGGYTGIEDAYQNGTSGDNFESEPVGKVAGIQIQGLRKMYNKKKVAVNGLTLNMFQDQITVLLGHNGAGKTTTMSMLTGMFPPTSGSAIINGCDIRTDIDGVRKSLGLCPQHNVLFDELTVREHILFFCRLKGMSDEKQIESEIKKYVKLLDLVPKIDAMSSTLSGGMKRKLSAGVALCGGSKVVLFDEPTSGMDPAARRSLWDLLNIEKKGRTILLSTHFMDEADVLGDRIAILCEGDLRCSGSSFFLKKKFGVGYHLICVKRPNCKTYDITNLLKKYIPGVVVESDIGAELSYQLPDEHSKVFETMLGELEDCSDDFNLDGYGISLTTLEEVFMRIGTDKLEEIDDSVLGDTDNESMSAYDPVTDNRPLLKGPNLMKNQWCAMLLKKYYYTIRNWLLLLIQNFIPIFFIVITVLIVKSFKLPNKLPPLSISLNTYGETFTVLEDAHGLETNSLEAKTVVEYGKILNSFGPQKQFIKTHEKFQDYILDVGKKELAHVNMKYMVGASVEKDNLTAWFNNQAYHTSPLALNLLHNALLRATTNSTYKISLRNAPLPFTPDYQMQLLKFGNSMGFQLSLNLGFAMSFVTAFYILFLIKERESRSKLLQFVSGVSVNIFWLATYLWDFITYILTALLVIITLAIFQQDDWSTFSQLGWAYLVLILFGFSAIPLTYIASLLFSDPSTGFSRISIFNIFTGMAMFTIVFAMSIFDLKEASDIISAIFRIFPHFSLSQSITYMNTMRSLSRICKQFCEMQPLCTEKLLCTIKPECCKIDYLSWEQPGIASHLIYMPLSGVCYFVILLIKELRILDEVIYKIQQYFSKPPKAESEDGIIDEDVQAEKDRVKNMAMEEIESHNLVMNRMTKYYNKKMLAVNQISVGVKHSECFGLLGVNGAGKTSTFKMLTGDEKISFGEAYVKGINLKNNMRQVYREIGYCPQFDALLEDLTGRETMKIFCLLRGIPNSTIDIVTKNLSTNLNFWQHIDKKVKEYSGGNKRKLSTAVALIGYPAVMYLDEPTTGMDPKARRQLWNLVCKVRDSGKSVVLTSHSMEECEALCTRLAIMVNGEFKCLGSTQHLKNKYLKGLLLMIKLRKENKNQANGITPLGQSEIVVESLPMRTVNPGTEKVKRFISSSFSDAVLKEEYQEMLTYFITATSIKWSKIFGLMEKNKDELNIEDYSLSQTTLEQVFLEFAKHQREDM